MTAVHRPPLSRAALSKRTEEPFAPLFRKFVGWISTHCFQLVTTHECYLPRWEIHSAHFPELVGMTSYEV